MKLLSNVVRRAEWPMAARVSVAALVLCLAVGCTKEEQACTARGYENDVLVLVSQTPTPTRLQGAAVDVCLPGNCHQAEPFGKGTLRAVFMELRSDPVLVELKVDGRSVSRTTVTPTVTYPEGEKCTAVYRATVKLPRM